MKRAVRVGTDEKLVLTANRLLDGTIVWRDRLGQWQPHIGVAEKFDAEQIGTVLELAQVHAQADGIVGVYQVAVKDVEPPEPVTVRERIRAYGPTVHPEFAVETVQ